MFSSGNDIVRCPGCSIPVSAGQPRSECFNCAAYVPSSPSSRRPPLLLPAYDDLVPIVPTWRAAAGETCGSSPSTAAAAAAATARSSSLSTLDDPPPAYPSFRHFGTQMPSSSSAVRISCDGPRTGMDLEAARGGLRAGGSGGYGAVGVGGGETNCGGNRSGEGNSKSTCQGGVEGVPRGMKLTVLACTLLTILFVVAVVSLVLIVRPARQKGHESN